MEFEDNSDEWNLALDKELTTAMLKNYYEQVPQKYWPAFFKNTVQAKFNGDFARYTEWLYKKSELLKKGKKFMIKDMERAQSVETELLKETTKLLRESQTALKTLQEKTEAASLIENNERQARYYHDEVNTAMEALRKPIDQLEMIVDKEMWPMPSYGDLMFEV